MWGNAIKIKLGCSLSGITPTHVGKCNCFLHFANIGKDHPPPMWGNVASNLLLGNEIGITPTHVGK